MCILIFLWNFSFSIFKMQAWKMLLLMNKQETTMILCFYYLNLEQLVDNFVN
jgi:hypothetical protein